MRLHWFSRARVAVLAALALAAVVDAGAFGVLVGGDEGGEPAPAAREPDAVARAVIEAVAARDCSGITDLVADDAVLPATVTQCLAGRPSAIVFSDVTVAASTVGGDVASVVVGVSADGTAAEVTVDLRRREAGWLVASIG